MNKRQLFILQILAKAFHHIFWLSKLAGKREKATPKLLRSEVLNQPNDYTDNDYTRIIIDQTKSMSARLYCGWREDNSIIFLIRYIILHKIYRTRAYRDADVKYYTCRCLCLIYMMYVCMYNIISVDLPSGSDTIILWLYF